MSFAGHVLDMIARIKYNESIKKSRREHYARIKEMYLEQNNQNGHLYFKDKKISKEDLEKVKKQIRKKIKKERLIHLTWSISFTLIIVFVLFYFIYQLFNFLKADY